MQMRIKCTCSSAGQSDNDAGHPGLQVLKPSDTKCFRTFGGCRMERRTRMQVSMKEIVPQQHFEVSIEAQVSQSSRTDVAGMVDIV